MEKNPDLLDSKDAAAHIHKTPDWVRRKLKHRVPFIQHEEGGPLYFWRTDLDRYLAERTQKPIR
jgi:hypothetical protein